MLVSAQHVSQFQFPSNGKAYPKRIDKQARLPGLQSFNSLQTGKPIQRNIPSSQSSLTDSFNSLQTGKPIQSLNKEKFLARKGILFQFPSNGKAYPKFILLVCPFNCGLRFQFPSNGKAYPKNYRFGAKTETVKFQFPSNGKAYPKDKYLLPRYTCFSRCSFNSLQTGKPIQRYLPTKGRISGKSFNSLQTGKPIQRNQEARPQTEVLGFNSLQTGKPIQSGTVVGMQDSSSLSFNSLQTGKPIQSSPK